MSYRLRLMSVTVLAVILLAACGGGSTPDPVGMPNPASVYCEEHDGTLEIRTDEAGGQYGVCIFDDGSECEEWAFFNQECKPGDLDTAPAPLG
jgi:putative hemolysin